MPDHTPLRLLIVDDDPDICRLCAAIAGRLGLESVPVESVAAALRLTANRPAELILADIGEGEGSGLQLLAEAKCRWPLTEVALMSAYASTESAMQAMRLGAYDFVVKPFRVEELELVLERMAEKARLVREIGLLRYRLQRRNKPAASPCTDLEELERTTVQRVFEQVEGDKEQAQRLLGISRATLYRKIKRYGIEGVARRKRTAKPVSISPLEPSSRG